MRSLSGAATTALAASEVMLVALVRLDFPSGTIALNSSTYTLTWAGVTYTGASGLGAIDPIDDKPGQVTGISLSLLQVDSSYLAIALDDADQVQGTPVTIMTAILDRTTFQIIDAPIDWAGYADTMSISEDGDTAVIAMSAESKAVDLLRSSTLVYNDADQQSIVPGDTYFGYVADQSAKPVVWPARSWFYK